MIAYKKVTRDFREFVLTLSVPPCANVVSKDDYLRASVVEVLSAEGLDGRPSDHKVFFSLYDWGFRYRVGERAESCMPQTRGIYCFRAKSQAVSFMQPKPQSV